MIYLYLLKIIRFMGYVLFFLEKTNKLFINKIVLNFKITYDVKTVRIHGAINNEFP